MKSFILKLFLFSLLFIKGGNVFAGTIYLCGDVREAETGSLLPGARVEVVGLPIGAMTDDDGRYSLDLPNPGTYKIKFSFLGYSTKVITVDLSNAEDGDIIVTGDVKLGFSIYKVAYLLGKTSSSRAIKSKEKFVYLKKEEFSLLLI